MIPTSLHQLPLRSTKTVDLFSQSAFGVKRLQAKDKAGGQLQAENGTLVSKSVVSVVQFP